MTTTQRIFTLENGLQCSFQAQRSSVAHVVVAIRAGARDELDHQQGLAHFLEHNLFKGTSKRKAYHILSRLDDVGGELNAYTTKEETIIHASFLKTDFRRALELLYDVLANSTFPEKELEKEKEVIKDEISSYKDAPGESIFDDFEDHIFRGDPLGRNILGTPESVDGLSRADILEFQSRTYTANRIKLAVVGPFGGERVERTVAELFAGFQFADSNWENTFKGDGQPDRVVENLAQFQDHYMVGWRTCGIHGHDRRSLSLLNNILGGPAMNSRLGLNIREKHGIAYNIESYLNLYSDVGMMGIYLGCDPQQTEKAAALVAKEVAKLRDTKLGTLQMSKAKKQFLGQMAMSEDNGLNSAVGAARALLHFGRVNDFETVASKIQAITAEQLQDVANAYLVPDKAFELIYKKQ
ncbi:MAG: insulinase family protein [Flavobacteriales bacterium]|jgi:predicted Zn-dependent peptidase|nr:insulinase family protein [Flavobacteriales bacterium]MDA8993839.1 insulinase family protein [Schleiferiaceae bacterium]MDP4759309.1 insulinase family protein [Schleiferiaceae bacterium]MDP4768332.1 insulinase family protein [Schleiferiaceae bacterium]MDP4959668.1 insulinase family protein [Schleiferiaceae bacterium]